MSDVLYYPHKCEANHDLEVTTLITERISAAFSILGSSYIVHTTWKKWRLKKSSIDPYQRIMVGLSLFDIVYSFFVWFLNTWMAPSVTGWWGASGNAQTCSAQGFFYLAAFGIGFYQALLCLFMFLLVVYGWTTSKFERKIERRMHVAISVIVIIIAAVPLFFQGYNPNCGRCYSVPLPAWCGDWLYGNGTTCVRGSPTLAHIYHIAQMAVTVAITLFCCSAMYGVYRSVRNQENKTAKYRHGGDHHQESKRIRTTMLLYTTSFLLCWILPIILWSIDKPALRIIANIFAPLQGFFNMLVFLQPKCLKYKKDRGSSSLLGAYFCVICKTDELSKAAGRVTSYIRGRTSTNQETGPEETDLDDGIGFNDYNVERPPSGVDATAEESLATKAEGLIAQSHLDKRGDLETNISGIGDHSGLESKTSRNE